MTSSSTTASPPDHEVMAQVRAGDLGQLSVLFERHHKRLYHYCRRLTRDAEIAQDLVQEVFMRVLKYRESFERDRSFLPWVYRMARNASFDHLRKSRWEVDREEWDEPAKGPLPVEEAERNEELRLLRGALDRLPDDKREVIVLARFGALKYDEIAVILGCSVGAVKVRVHRAVKQLREAYFELAEGSAS